MANPLTPANARDARATHRLEMIDKAIMEFNAKVKKTEGPWMLHFIPTEILSQVRDAIRSSGWHVQNGDHGVLVVFEPPAPQTNGPYR